MGCHSNTQEKSSEKDGLSQQVMVRFLIVDADLNPKQSLKKQPNNNDNNKNRQKPNLGGKKKYHCGTNILLNMPQLNILSAHDQVSVLEDGQTSVFVYLTCAKFYL